MLKDRKQWLSESIKPFGIDSSEKYKAKVVLWRCYRCEVAGWVCATSESTEDVRECHGRHQAHASSITPIECTGGPVGMNIVTGHWEGVSTWSESNI